eukprot:763029-Pleurochrysis_carterae.AAC.1
MHTVPSVAELGSLAALTATVKKCDFSATPSQRTRRAHEPFKGKLLPCDCCDFAADATTRDAEYTAFQSKLKALKNAADTAAGKKDLA